MLTHKESDKQKMKALLNTIEKEMYNKIYPNNTINGFIVLLIHWSIVGWAALYIFFGEVNIYFFISTIIWLIIFSLHIYFRGCILTKIEKHLWKAKDWSGPWSLPMKILENNNIHPANIKHMYVYWACSLIIFICLKIWYSVSK